ncbi:MAG: family 16 glycosylhydrolase [Flavobacteriaceae bacterium]|nr:family 16 glycosylhydrolase [Flavobacteriaceae bacterium]
MKNFKYLVFVCMLSLIAGFFLTSCQDENQTFGDIVAPSNLSVSFDIQGVDAMNPNGDGTGFVSFTATADNAITYRYVFGDDSSNEVAPSGQVTHRFTNNGLNTYTVTVIASGTGGVTTSTSVNVEVFSSFNPIEIKNLLTGGPSNSKTWYWNAPVPGHLGVGPLDDVEPIWYAAVPYEKESVGCLYEDQLIFSQDDSENVNFELINNDNTYFHRFEVEDELGQPNPGEDTCYPYEDFGMTNVSFAPSSSGIDETISTQTSFTLPNNGFMSYFLGNNDYEILSISATEMHVRIVQTEPSGFQVAWYQKFSTQDPLGDNGLVSIYDNLIWSDEFDTDGAPNPANWVYDLQDGCQIDPNLCGWGNGEEQWYTNDPDNVIVEGGILKITAIKEPTGTRDYSSARIKTHDLFDFNTGRVEFSAKLPASVGTWPALWMLGSNNDEVGWPASGEIDIMEHSPFFNPNEVVGTVYWENEGSVASFGETIDVSNLSSEFHTYTLEWRPDEILMAVDGEIYFTFAYDDSLPFVEDFFLIINLAMGGDFGGDIDPGFTQDTFEVDYVRVYQ